MCWEGHATGTARGQTGAMTQSWHVGQPHTASCCGVIPVWCTGAASLTTPGGSLGPPPGRPKPCGPPPEAIVPRSLTQGAAAHGKRLPKWQGNWLRNRRILQLALNPGLQIPCLLSPPPSSRPMTEWGGGAPDAWWVESLYVPLLGDAANAVSNATPGLPRLTADSLAVLVTGLLQSQARRPLLPQGAML
jgi:hypothetical protein